MNQGPRWDCLMKKTEGRKSRVFSSIFLYTVGSVMKKFEIRNEKCSDPDPGFGINIPDSQHCLIIPMGQQNCRNFVSRYSKIILLNKRCSAQKVRFITL
jgi:hypothetical protein